MKNQPLDPDVLNHWRISGALSGLFMGAAMGTVMSPRGFGGLVTYGVIGLVGSELAFLIYRKWEHLKFSIRDLLLVTLCVALALGWWVDRSTKLARISKEVETWKERAEKSKDLIEYSSGYALEWTETMPAGRPPWHPGPLVPVKE